MVAKERNCPILNFKKYKFLGLNLLNCYKIKVFQKIPFSFNNVYVSFIDFYKYRFNKHKMNPTCTYK